MQENQVSEKQRVNGTLRIMMMLAVACLVGFLLTACGSNPSRPDPVQTRTVFIEPSAALVQDCAITAPPNRKEYTDAAKSGDKDKQIALLHSYALRLQSNVGDCNSQWASLREWVKKEKEIFTRDNPKKAP